MPAPKSPTKLRYSARAHLASGALALTAWAAMAALVLTVYAYSHLAAAAVALAGAFAAASLSSTVWWAHGLRLSSFPMLGLAVFSRSDYWFLPVAQSFERILRMDEPLHWAERLYPTSDWWKVALIGSGFLVYYTLLSRWPEVAHKREGKRRGALAVCAATQLIIVATVGIGSLAAITGSMLLGGVVAPYLSREFKPIYLAFFIMAPAYALSSPVLCSVLSVASGLALALTLPRYNPSIRLLDAGRGVALLVGLSPLIFLQRGGPELTFLGTLFFSGLVLALALAKRPATVGMELAAAALGAHLVFISGALLSPWGYAYLIPLASALLFATLRRLTPTASLYVRALLLWAIYALFLMVAHQLSPTLYFLPLALLLFATGAFTRYSRRGLVTPPPLAA